MKRLVLFCLIIVVYSCNEWQELELTQLFNNSGISLLFDADDKITSVKHNLDTGVVTFLVEEFEIDKFKELDEIAMVNGWCIVNKLNNERLYVLPNKETFINAEIIEIYFDERIKSGLITISH